MQLFEKLGSFYLGKAYDIAANQLQEDLVLYDARDLTTHAVCVGMTGSGKTGLCIDLLEEAAIDNIPAIIIDPKGDITNLLLAFPDLRPDDFEPWVNADDARRKDLTVTEFAQKTAETWRAGLEQWGQGADRIRLLKDSAEFRIYTPGSDSGLPVSILASFNAPGLSWDDEPELIREQIQGIVSALLGLIGIDADPLRSREHILLSTIIEHYWRQGQDLDLATLIKSIQTPPIRQLGVFDIDTFYPEKERFALAVALNNIIAAPSFATWLQGEALDIAAFLHAANGKPRHSIFYIAHLSDAERMFFVTLLLEQVITWMRKQSGTTSLRALLYMDEIFGYFPPTANPPSKRPMLTLMKQARAFGVGVMLTTQNPVDLDYKGLTNAGTWFIGKLQTERDKARMLDGLESVSSAAGGALDRQTLDRMIGALGSRVFLLHNVHEDRPVLFQTRWAMSYLCGPLTRSQVRTLMTPLKKSDPSSTPPPAVAPSAAAADYSLAPPTLPSELTQIFLPVRVSPNRALALLEDETQQQLELQSSALVYEPALLALARVSFVDRVRGVDTTLNASRLIYTGDLGAVVRWEDADAFDLTWNELDARPEADARFATVPDALNSVAELKRLGKDFSDHLYRQHRLTIFYNPELKLYGQPNESERDFKARAQLLAREKRDAEVDALRDKYERERQRVEDRIEREQNELTEDKAQYDARRAEEFASGAEQFMKMFGLLGRRRSASVSSTFTKRRMTSTARADVAESESEIAHLKEQLALLQKEMEDDARAIGEKWADIADQIETYQIAPRRNDIQIDAVALAWLPYWQLSYRDSVARVASDRITAWR